jgi:hypothetical protein
MLDGKTNGSHNISCETKKKGGPYCYRNIPFVTLGVCRRRQSYLKGLSQIYLRGCFETWKDSVECCVALKGIPRGYRFVNSNFGHKCRYLPVPVAPRSKA